MDKNEFIKYYCERSGVTWEWLQQHKVALPCKCGEDGCDGWAMVSKDVDMVKTHMELYADRRKGKMPD